MSDLWWYQSERAARAAFAAKIHAELGPPQTGYRLTEYGGRILGLPGEFLPHKRRWWETDIPSLHSYPGHRWRLLSGEEVDSAVLTPGGITAERTLSEELNLYPGSGTEDRSPAPTRGDLMKMEVAVKDLRRGDRIVGPGEGWQLFPGLVLKDSEPMQARTGYWVVDIEQNGRLYAGNQWSDGTVLIERDWFVPSILTTSAGWDSKCARCGKGTYIGAGTRPTEHEAGGCNV